MMFDRIRKATCVAAMVAPAVIGLGLAGCSMCCGPYDYHYPTFGGKHERTDPVYGRVGSIFSDPNVALGPSADSNLVPHPAVQAPRAPVDYVDVDSDEDIDADIDSELDLDDELQPINPDDRDIDRLPKPDGEADEASEVTALRTWRHRPSRR